MSLTSNLTKSRVYLLYTGGTIGMMPNDDHVLTPVKGKLSNLIEQMKLDNQLEISYRLDRILPLIDSANLQTINWRYMLEKLTKYYKSYDAFIVIHGTDTLAYTASALSFFLADWKKPIIVTGSQIPMVSFRNDAKRNLIDSLKVAISEEIICGVFIVFGGNILRGNRSIKYNSNSLQAFHSPNYPLIGKIRRSGKFDNLSLVNCNFINSQNLFPISFNKYLRKWRLDKWNSDTIKIYSLTILPDNNSSHLKALIDLDPSAIILRSYGVGNAPLLDKKLIKLLKEAISKNIIIINSSQCIKGGIDMTSYQSGRQLKRIGIISGMDMTFETIFTKLYYLFQLIGDSDYKLIKRLFKINLAGELN